MTTIYREQGLGGDVPGYCAHSHRSPRTAFTCRDTHQAAAPTGMRSTASVLASDDAGLTWRHLTGAEFDTLDEYVEYVEYATYAEYAIARSQEGG